MHHNKLAAHENNHTTIHQNEVHGPKMQSKGNQEQDQDGHGIADEQDPHPLTQGVTQIASMRHSDGDDVT